jgi:hypothetical protein
MELRGASPPPDRELFIDALSPFFDPAKPSLRSWSMPFGHMDLTSPPYVDLPHMDRVAKRFADYCQYVAGLGYTGLTLGNWIHLTTLDRVPEGKFAVYSEEDPYRQRHSIYKRYFSQLVKTAHAFGLTVVVETDFPAWTPPLLHFLGPAGLSLANPRLWEAYRAAVLELLEEVNVDGLSVRIGEGGGAYNDPLAGYSSTVLIHRVADAHRLIHELLGTVEAFNQKSGSNRKLLFRTWTIGLGELGRLHTDPALYERVFSPFYGREALVTVIKHVANDFYEFVPRNPTIGVGQLKQIVEFQARREFEGFGLFPNYRGATFEQDLRIFERLPQYAGGSVWVANGGFLFDAPVYYRSTGQDEWIDLNAQAYARLFHNDHLSSRSALREWLEKQALPEADWKVACRVLERSEEVVRKGFYVSAYAHRPPSLLGLERLPPMLWFWWTRPTAAYAVQVLLFRAAESSWEQAITEGKQATSELAAMLADAELMHDSPFRTRLVESLKYEEDVLDILAAYRVVFLNHYRWALRGDANAYGTWQEGLSKLHDSVQAHLGRYGARSDFPALDVREIDRMLQDDRWARQLRPAAGLLALISFVAGCLAVSGRSTQNPRQSLAHFFVILLLIALSTVIFFCGFAAFWTGGVAVLWVGLYGLLSGSALVFLSPIRGTASGNWRRVGGASVCLMTPFLWWQALILAIFAARGPAPIYFIFINALDQAWARQLLTGVAAAFLLAMVLSGWKAAGGAEGLSFRRRWILPLALQTVVALVLTVALGRVAAGHASQINHALRVGPSVFGEAGPGVGELSKVSLSEKDHRNGRAP